MVVITKYDRLARSLPDLLSLVETIKEKGAHFRSITEDVNTSTPTGRLTFHIFGSIAQFQRELIVERTNEGLAAAKKRGRVIGRPPALSPDQQVEARRMRDEERRPISEVARLFEVSTQTIRRA